MYLKVNIKKGIKDAFGLAGEYNYCRYIHVTKWMFDKIVYSIMIHRDNGTTCVVGRTLLVFICLILNNNNVLTFIKSAAYGSK